MYQNVHALNEEIARALIKAGARKPTVSSSSRLPDGRLDRMYSQEFRLKSSSGLLPSSLLWFTSTHRIQLQSAFLLMTYQQLCQSMKRRMNMPPDAIARAALTRAITLYQEVAGGKESVDISADRAAFFLRAFSDAMWLSTNGNDALAIKLSGCSLCRVPLMIPRHHSEYHCTACKPRLRRASRAKPHDGEKLAA
ncbi:FlhC family transcriptional regulator [Paraburkholderia sp. J8-2]|uniref:FlhC family transcriptional regulator n=1 Tax=Paraburkholderia sp. J8-2 TaxID=2805440 RepID=UPI002AB6EFB9|nr:FlhC family transcriptional regulator [Paraburkholderia sp. J8-2]